MQKFFSVLGFILLVLTGMVLHAQDVYSCIYNAGKIIGKAKIKLKFSKKNTSVNICFSLKLKKQKKLPKYIGYKYSFRFKSTSIQYSTVLPVAKFPGYIRIFPFKKKGLYCLSLKLKMSYKKVQTYSLMCSWNWWQQKRQCVHIKLTSSKLALFGFGTYWWYKQDMFNYLKKMAKKHLLKENLVRMFPEKKGASIGLPYDMGSLLKGGCNSSSFTKWDSLKLMKARISDFK